MGVISVLREAIDKVGRVVMNARVRVSAASIGGICTSHASAVTTLLGGHVVLLFLAPRLSSQGTAMDPITVTFARRLTFDAARRPIAAWPSHISVSSLTSLPDTSPTSRV